MTKDSKLKQVLDDCLYLLIHEDQTVEQCLERYPEFAGKLPSLLGMAVSVRASLGDWPLESAAVRSRALLNRAMAQEATSTGCTSRGDSMLRGSILPIDLASVWRLLRSQRWLPGGKQRQHAELVDRHLQSAISDGRSLDSYLASDPDLAPRLRPLVALVLTGRRSLVDYPGRQAAARSWNRLQAEFDSSATLVYPSDRWSALRKLISAPAPRRAALGAAVAVTVAIAAFVTVSAAQGSAPGDALYPVNLSSERVQDFLTFSSSERARLALQRTEARATELAAAISSGDIVDVRSGYERLRRQLDSAAQGIARQTDEATRTEMQRKFEQVAERHLAQLESVALASPGRSDVAELVRSMATSYAVAVEVASAGGQAPSLATSLGALEIHIVNVGDAVSGVDGIGVEVSLIEIFRPGPDGGLWVPVLDQSGTFSLAGGDTSQNVVTRSGVPAGTYTRLRLTFDGAQVTTDDKTHLAESANRTVTLSRPLTVRGNTTAMSTLGLDVSSSLVLQPSGIFAFDPVVHLYSTPALDGTDTSRRSGEPGEPGTQGREDEPLPGGSQESARSTEMPADGPPMSEKPVVSSSKDDRATPGNPSPGESNVQNNRTNRDESKSVGIAPPHSQSPDQFDAGTDKKMVGFLPEVHEDDESSKTHGAGLTNRRSGEGVGQGRPNAPAPNERSAVGRDQRALADSSEPGSEGTGNGNSSASANTSEPGNGIQPQSGGRGNGKGSSADDSGAKNSARGQSKKPDGGGNGSPSSGGANGPDQGHGPYTDGISDSDHTDGQAGRASRSGQGRDTSSGHNSNRGGPR